MAADTGQFFNPWESPPRFTAPPEDSALDKRVVKLAEYCVRNGPSFIGIFKQKQQDNQEYAFLSGGEGAEYWRWVLYCRLYNFPPEHNPSAGQDQPMAEASSQQPEQTTADSQHHPVEASDLVGQQPSATPQHSGEPPREQQGQPDLPPEYASSFAQVLAALTGSRESVEASRDWFLACEAYAEGMAAQLATHMLQLPNFEAQQPLLYLVNAILFAGLGKRAEGTGPEADHMAAAFKPHLPGLLTSLRRHAADDQQAVGMLDKICSFWGEKGVFHVSTIADWKQVMASATSQPQEQAAGHAASPAASLAAAGTPAASTAPSSAMQQSSYGSQPQQQPSPYHSQPLQPNPQSQQHLASPHSHLSPSSQPMHDQQVGQVGYPGQYQGQPHNYQGQPQQQHGSEWGGHASQPPWGQPAMQDAGAVPWQQTHSSYPPPMTHQHMGHQPGGYPSHAPPWGHQPVAPMQPHYQPPHAAQYATPYPAAPVPPLGGHAMSHQYAVPPPHVNSMAQPAPAWYPAPPGAAAGQAAAVAAVAAAFPDASAGPGGPQYTPPPLALAAAAAAAALNKPAAEGKERSRSPADPMSFPPGLIPELVRHKLETDPPYSPLSTLDVDRAGLPEPTQPDAYLKARLDKFHAELKAWRPGTMRADLEDEHRKSAGGDAATDAGASSRSRRRNSEAGTKDDGSSKGGLGSGGGQGSGMAGLGWSADEEAAGSGLDSSFDSFRKQRAGHYRDTMAKAAAVAQAT